MPIKSRLLTFVNSIINIIFLYIIYFKYVKEINLLSMLLTFLVIISYYVFDVFSLERGKYVFNDFLHIFVINALTVLIFYKSLGLRQIVQPIFYLIVFQNLIKILNFTLFVKTKSVLLIGLNEKIIIIREILLKKLDYRIVGEIGIEEINQIEELVEKKKVDKIVITENINDKSIVEKILHLKLKGVQVFDFISFYEKVEEKVPVKSINEEWILYGSGYDILHRGFNIRLKRVIDIVFSIIIGLLALPIILVSAIIVKIESKGPIFFKQNRVGLRNEEFEIYKFRSMVLHIEEDHSRYAQKGDNRITRFGNFMRKTRIDELPQLWNVIKGDMSFIGPRAEWNKLVNEYKVQIPFYSIRHSIKPGLTGWAQVRYPYGMDVDDAREKLRYDLYYIKYQNLIFDIVILFRTMKIVLFGRGK